MESNCHKKVKTLLCGGKTGTEYSSQSGKRIDCRAPKTHACYEVELNRAKLGDAVSRLLRTRNTGECRNATIVTRDKYIGEAQRLVMNKNIKVIPISKVPGVKLSI